MFMDQAAGELMRFRRKRWTHGLKSTIAADFRMNPVCDLACRRIPASRKPLAR
jgi:hypothetical protein